MQTFCPIPSFIESSLVLDQRRRCKQITETLQILDALLDGGGWSNHPACRMWAGHERNLIMYNSAMYHSFVRNGGTSSHKSYFKMREKYQYLPGSPMPDWWGDERIHSSHRARLLHKGNIDVLRRRIKILGEKPDEFVSTIFGRGLKLKDVTVQQAFDLAIILDRKNAPRFDNHYDQFYWSELPGDEYVWPVPTLTATRS